MSAFGTPSYGAANTANLPGYQADPSKFAAFDTSQQANNAAAGIGEDTSIQQAQALARASQLGAGRSAGAARTVQDIGAKGAQNLANFRANAAQGSFEDQLKQMFANNQFNLGIAQAANQKFANEASADAAEKARRAAPLGHLGGVFNA